MNPNLPGVQDPPITEVKGWLAERNRNTDRPLVDCCQAVPEYPPSADLVAFMQEQLLRPETSRYTPDEGLAEVRQSVSCWYARRYDGAPHADEVFMTVGASQAFWLAATVLLHAGDEVVLTAPAYFDHWMALRTLGVGCRWLSFDEGNQGLPSIAEIESQINDRTRAILLVTPSNPTGAVIPADLLDDLYSLARRRGLALILDETYNAFLPAGTVPHRLFAKPDWQKTLVHLASFGKTFALTGFRAGALVAGHELLRQAIKVQDTMAVCQPRITQLAVAYGCDHLDAWVAQNARMMQRRHDLFREAFRIPENPFALISSGGFFAWIKHPWTELDSRAAAKRLALEGDLICLPGAAFGPGLDRYLRLAFGNLPESTIPQAVNRFLSFSS